MPLYLASAADLAALPEGTRYHVYCDRPDLFGGKAVIGCDDKLTLTAAPTKYPNGVPIVDGCRPEPKTVEDKPLSKVDAAELSAAVAAIRSTPEGEKALAELLKPVLTPKAVVRP